jgi:hypothetical protein
VFGHENHVLNLFAAGAPEGNNGALVVFVDALLGQEGGTEPCGLLALDIQGTAQSVNLCLSITEALVKFGIHEAASISRRALTWAKSWVSVPWFFCHSRLPA